MSLDALLEAEALTLDRLNRLRITRSLEGREPHRNLGDRPLLSFASNDYLGLSRHPDVVSAASRALALYGAGSTGARLVTGNYALQDQLEAELADFVGFPQTLLFPSGYQANLGLVTALAGRGDLIVSDELNHASLIDGCRLSRAEIRVYRHANATDAARALADRKAFRRSFILSESLFSMDGDIAPLSALRELASACDAFLLVDEAHALGTQGPSGRGLCAVTGVQPDALMGTFGKAFGSSGAFVAGSSALRRHLVNHARPFIFTTAPPPPSIAAALESLRLLRSDEGELLRRTLQERIALLRNELGDSITSAAASPILPLVLGSETAALDASEGLLREGIYVPAIRPPTVPADRCRLRITVSALHTEGDMARLLQSLKGLRS